uniref:non-specific serine/threonine protein kinase n=1 Tax=Arcella intermedia TaxID=1963864 RepID=A0A6B2L505_9EUKA
MAEPKPSPDDYEWGNIVGEGAFGDVVKAVEKRTGRTFAVKKMLKSHLQKEQNKKFVMNERNVLSKCNHPNIVKLYSAFRDDQFFYYVLNFADNGEALKYIRNNQGLHLDLVKFWTAEVVIALEYLHTEVGVIHRDLKPENLLVDSNFHLLLTDFGTSKIVPIDEGAKPRKGSFVGTPEYMAPELVKETESCFASDLWSLGCTLYQMICARPPFRGVTEYLTMKKVMEGISAISFPEPFPPVARDLIEKLLHLDPMQRPGSKSYADLKKHPFFDGINWENLHSQDVPPIKGPDVKFVWQEDIIKEEQERQERERTELREKWKSFLYPPENIVVSGHVIKKRKMSKKRRFLILTDTPRLFYVDPKKMELKGEILWDKTLKVAVKNDVVWTVSIPKRVYDFEDISKEASRWKEGIEKLQKSKNE